MRSSTCERESKCTLFFDRLVTVTYAELLATSLSGVKLQYISLGKRFSGLGMHTINSVRSAVFLSSNCRTLDVLKCLMNDKWINVTEQYMNGIRQLAIINYNNKVFQKHSINEFGYKQF